MRLDRVLLIIGPCALLAAVASGCTGGGSSNAKAPDSSKISTATLPAKLPDPKILSNSVVQSGGGSSYTIRDGDTLAGIASRLGITLDDLRAANPGLDPGSLRVGQTIKLPQNTEAPPAASATPGASRGSATAEAATVTPAAAATEPPPPTEAPASPTAAPPQPTPAEVTATPSSVGQTYTVEQGDFPAKIAEKFGITVEALLAANPGINPTDMHIGDVIVIPPKPAG